jgi:SAM-dependent methyltransferase
MSAAAALTLLFQIALGAGLLVGLSAYLSVLWGAPWVPVPRRAMRAMLRLAQIRPGERVVDLGAGDGRLVRRAARDHQAQAVGVEIDPLRCLMANVGIRLGRLGGQARVVWGNLYEFDLRGADVVLLYLLQSTNARLRSKLARELKPGARIVSRSFTLPDWTPAVIDEANEIFVYHVVPKGIQVETRFV